ncbi:MAG: SDR family oxidoreductase [Acidobacteria bacterium]|nr:SDR family oxidoreductase [Acidobacteriota bacterium]
MQRTALVTGGSRGIGAAIARRLAADGLGVCINYRTRREEAEKLAAEIQAEGNSRVMAYGADVANPMQLASMVYSVEQQLGGIDVLVNNAGIIVRGDIEDFDFAQMDFMRRTNVDGLVAMTRAVLPGMKERRFGRIVNLTSIAAHGTALPGTTFYAATKAAVSVLTRRFAMDLGPYGITVNAVAPGFIITDMVTDGRTDEEVDRIREALASKSMVRRVGTPADIAGVVSFLASDDASFMTAQVLTIDGGRMDYINHG